MNALHAIRRSFRQQTKASVSHAAVPFVSRSVGGGPATSPGHPPSRRSPVNYWHYSATAMIVGLCGLLGWISKSLHLEDANIVMILLAGVVFVAARFGRGPAIAAAVFGVLLFDYFFVPPAFSFTPTDAQYFIITLGVLLEHRAAHQHAHLTTAGPIIDLAAARASHGSTLSDRRDY